MDILDKIDEALENKIIVEVKEDILQGLIIEPINQGIITMLSASPSGIGSGIKPKKDEAILSIGKSYYVIKLSREYDFRIEGEAAFDKKDDEIRNIHQRIRNDLKKDIKKFESLITKTIKKYSK